jgi:hypothetical protein
MQVVAPLMSTVLGMFVPIEYQDGIIARFNGRMYRCSYSGN